MTRRLARRALLLMLAGLPAACGRNFAPLPEPANTLADVAALPPIRFPADELPHANLTEWWYFTGFLQTQANDRFGFEFVIFQAIRGNQPPGYAAHFAITDLQARRFTFDQRTALAHGAWRREGLDLCVGGWELRLDASGFLIRAATQQYSLDIVLAPRKPPVVHNRSGILDFSPYGWSYYYSYPRLDVVGQVRAGAAPAFVRGSAWMDHQWGDFISVGSGGWDWFSLQLDDGRDFTASVVRDDSAGVVLKYGTLIDLSGNVRHLTHSEFQVAATGSWTSPRSGAVYPSGWRLIVPSAAIDFQLVPLLLDQELDTRASTGVVYWEGAVEARSGGSPAGNGYVELTGYARSAPAVSPAAPAKQNLCG